MAVDSPEYSVLPATSTGKTRLSTPVPAVATATATQSREVDREEQESAGTARSAGGRYEKGTVPVRRHNSPCITSCHLANRRNCQRQSHEPHADVISMDHVGGKETYHGPEYDAMGEIDRQGHLEVIDYNHGPVPGENDKVA